MTLTWHEGLRSEVMLVSQSCKVPHSYNTEAFCRWKCSNTSVILIESSSLVQMEVNTELYNPTSLLNPIQQPTLKSKFQEYRDLA